MLALLCNCVATMESPSKLGQCVDLFKAMGELNRAKIIEYLGACAFQKNLCVSEIRKCCDVDFSVVSRHLTQLKNSGVIDSQKKGREVFYSLNAKELAVFFRELANFFDSCEQVASSRRTENK